MEFLFVKSFHCTFYKTGIPDWFAGRQLYGETKIYYQYLLHFLLFYLLPRCTVKTPINILIQIEKKSRCSEHKHILKTNDPYVKWFCAALAKRGDQRECWLMRVIRARLEIPIQLSSQMVLILLLTDILFRSLLKSRMANNSYISYNIEM